MRAVEAILTRKDKGSCSERILQVFVLRLAEIEFELLSAVFYSREGVPFRFIIAAQRIALTLDFVAELLHSRRCRQVYAAECVQEQANDNACHYEQDYHYDYHFQCCRSAEFHKYSWLEVVYILCSGYFLCSVFDQDSVKRNAY
jgi:hypothetical protein